jgi:hypothetical protein
MAVGTYAMILNDVVIDIIQFDVLSGEPIPVQDATLIKVNELIPTIGQIWNGEIFE